MNIKSTILSTLFLLMICCSAVGQDSSQRTLRDFRRMGLPIYEATEMKLLPTATEKFRDLFGEIDKAERYILLDYFKFQQDSICGALLDKLYRKVAEGVDVHIIFDSFGNRHSDLPLSDTLMQSIRQRGISIKDFDPMRFPWINHLLHRNHHKIAVIDGRMVYTGGMNVADYYLHGKPKIGQWRDMHIRMKGPIVQAYEELFWRMWNHDQNGPSTGLPGPTPNPSLVGRGEDTSGKLYTPLPTREGLGVGPVGSEGPEVVAFASRWPKESPAIMRQTYVVAIDNADHLVQIVNPYAMLFGEVRQALRRALLRGVRVQFMVSTKSDGKANDDVIGLEMRKLMKRGAEVYYYDHGFHHSKVMMVDSLFCTVGTTNLDARSLCFDYEVNAFIFSPGITHELQRIYADDIRQHCTLLTPEVFKERFPLRRRIRSRFFTIAKHLM